MEVRTRARGRARAGAALAVVALAVIAAVACSSTTLQGTIAIITGPDDGFTMAPEPVRLAVQFINSNGVATLAGETKLPSDGGLTLPTQPGANVDIIQVTGFDDAGDAVVSGATIPIALDQLSGITLNVFAQRTGQFARLPSSDGSAAATVNLPGPVPLLTTLYGRYLLIADGTGKSTNVQLYDVLTWSTEPAPPCLAIPSVSLASVETYTGSDAAPDAATTIAALLELGANGKAVWLDITDSTACGPDGSVASEASAPDSGQFALAAGGQTVIVPAPSGSGLIFTNSYIVGGTRPATDGGKPTTEVLRISPSGVLSWANLHVPRLGAAATSVPASPNGGSGIYVFGGTAPTDAGGDAKPTQTGVEFISDNSAMPTFSAAVIPGAGLAPDTTTGAGAVTLTASNTSATILLAGGVMADGKPAPVRVVTFGADAGFGGTADAGDGGSWPQLPVTYVSTQVFALAPPTSTQHGSVIVIGTERSGATSAYILTEGSASALAVPFKQARTNAQAIILPNGSLAVVGGDAGGTMESFIP
jgi:hypothetical protein